MPSGTFSGSRVRTRLDPNDAYVYLLWIALAGYALFGKGFAYVGYPPLLIGEVAMVLGLVVIFRSAAGLAMLASFPSILLVALIGWVAVRTIQGLGPYGVDAIRDSVIVIYGLYAFTVIALLLEKPERLTWTIKAYSRFAWLYGLVGGIMTYITTAFATFMPIWPLSGVSVVYVRLGEAAVHLSGAAVFVILGLRQTSLAWVLALFVSVLMITPSRGAMLACLIPIGVAVLLSGQLRRFVQVLFAGTAILFVCYIVGLEIPLSGGRTLGPEQLLHNLESIIGTSQAANLDGTKEWRLRWWQAIQDYTFRGPYFWTGKGFGMGLAEADGFVVGQEKMGPMVRSPHNAQLTILARAGVPGLVLWVTTGLVWFGMLFRNVRLAQRRGDAQWANIFIWVGCYGLSIVIDASFDVALEGPMLGIWFWALFGLGIGASMIYRWETLDGTRRHLM
jgi:hypothetical protein